MNLIQNAWDATEERYATHESPCPAIEVIASIEKDGQISISVIDSGSGIEVESGVLFEPFYTTKSIGQGTGLGLYTSYALAREVGGELSLANNDRGGATATLALPISSEELKSQDEE